MWNSKERLKSVQPKTLNTSTKHEASFRWGGSGEAQLDANVFIVALSWTEDKVGQCN